MLLKCLSDLHMHESDHRQSEAVMKCVKDPFYDGIVLLAGDVAPAPIAPMTARNLWPKASRIVLVPGNHEHCLSEWTDTVNIMIEEGYQHGVDVLHDSSVLITENNITARVLGTTLWTDYNIFGTPEISMPLMDEHFKEVGLRNPLVTRISSLECLNMHIESRKWLNAMLDVAHDGPTIVMTHHLPSWNSVHPQFKNSPTTAVFASHADELASRCCLYIHGHTHCFMQWRTQTALVFCNPCGRWKGSINQGCWENKDFNPYSLIKITPLSNDWVANII